MALRGVLSGLLQQVNETAIGRDAVIGDRKGKDRESLLSIDCQEISSSLLPALLKFCEEPHAIDAGGFEVLE